MQCQRRRSMSESFADRQCRPPVRRVPAAAPKRELTMTNPIRFSRRSVLGLAAAASAGAGLGGGGDDGEQSGAGKKIRWWHIANTDPMLSKWAEMAKQFEAAHPGVKFEITPLE